VQARLPTLLPGNSQSIPSSGRGPRIDVYEGATYMSTCGAGSGIEIIVDEGDLLLTLGGFSCADPETTNRTFDVTVTACANAGCSHSPATTSLTLGGPAVAAQLCAPADPPPPCNSCSCKVGGGAGDGPPASPKSSGGGGSGDSSGTGLPIGGGGAQAAPPGQAGTTLRYTAGGAGTAGTPGAAAWHANLGRGWSHDFAERIVVDPDYQHVWFITRNANFVEFSDPSGGGTSLLYATVAPSDEFRKLHYDTSTGEWQLHWLDGTVQNFSTAGRWLSTVDRNGNAWEATGYTGDKIDGVTFPDGRSETFTYDLNGKLGTVVLAGVGGTPTRTWIYQWAGDDLYRIYQPDGIFRRFQYRSDYGYMTHQILVGSGSNPPERVEKAWEYDEYGNAVRFWRGSENPDPSAVEMWEVAFDDPQDPTEATVTDPLGGTSVFLLARDTVSRRPKVLSIDGACPSCGSSPGTTFTYDATHPLLVATQTDANGIRTDFTYDNFGRLASRTDAATTTGHPDLPRITQWQHDINFPAFVTSIQGPTTVGDTPSRSVTMTYDTSTGDLLSRTTSGNEVTYLGGTFSLQTTYSGYSPAGGVGAVDPPGYGTADQTTFTYNVPGRNGMLVDTRTEPLVGATSYIYDNDNRRTGATDPNGVLTETTYDTLNRVTSVINRGDAAVGTDDRTTTYTYNRFGDLYCVKSPAGAGTEYLYDPAGRLQEIRRGTAVTTPTTTSCLTISTTNIAERILYTLDAAGHRTNEKRDRGTSASAWTPNSETSYVYSTMCHLDQTIQKISETENAVTEYGYDCNGNLESTWDAMHPRASFPAQPSSVYGYDPLNRLTDVTQPWGGSGGGNTTSHYNYDVQDHLVEVVDGNGTVTSYEYSDRDLMTGQTSEVSGSATYAYNEHGEKIGETDGRGIATVRNVDAANRVTWLNLPGTTLDTTYSYGSNPLLFDVGRLTGITRNGSTVSYGYNPFGELLADGDLTYSRDKHGNPLTINYPGSLQAIYTYDKMDRPIRLQSKEGAAAAVDVVMSTPVPTYKAYGPLATLRLNLSGTNDRDVARTFDFRYQPLGITVFNSSNSLFAMSYVTDKVGNVLQQERTLPGPTDTRTYTYQDWQYPLASATGPWGFTSWTYDRSGSRLNENTGGDYYYLQNAAMTGVTSELSAVVPGIFEASNYTFDSGGYLDLFTHSSGGFTNDRTIDLTNDAAGQLSGLVASAPSMKNRTNSMLYDGRNFLKELSELNTGGYVRPTYSSAGTLHSLERLPVTGGTTERINVLYFAGSPIALWKKVGTGTATTTRLITDHLGTPMASIQEAGTAIDWYGGFKPFGEDWQAGTAQDSLTKGIFLRMPGQWKDPLWGTATYRMELFYNVNRWYEPQTGRYTKTDPLGLPDPVDFDDSYFNLYAYVAANPLVNIDPLGLATIGPDAPSRCRKRWENKVLPRLSSPSPKCKGFFCETLKTDLDALLQSPFPIIEFESRPGGRFTCDPASATAESTVIKLGRGSCRSTREMLHYVFHELGHYADCLNNGNRYPGHDEGDGCAAETACLGFSLGLNCRNLGYPSR
jgi:RHS repeat-associated protein